MPDQLLVTGLPRSGCSHLADLLSRHSDIAMLSEADQRSPELVLGKRYGGNKLYMPRQLGYKREEESVRRRSVRRKTTASKKAYLHSYMKNGTKIVVMLREANQVIGSLITKQSMRPDSAVKLWSRGMELTAKVVQRYPTGLFVVDYDSLMKNPELELMRLCSFLDLQVEDRMLAETAEAPDVLAQKPAADDRSEEAATIEDRLRLSEMAPRAFAMYNGVCAFRLAASGGDDARVTFYESDDEGGDSNLGDDTPGSADDPDDDMPKDSDLR